MSMKCRLNGISLGSALIYNFEKITLVLKLLVLRLHRGYYISAHVLLNQGKRLTGAQ